ncbi:MAG: gamma-glutamyltransferase [Rubrimonas sp.]
MAATFAVAAGSKLAAQAAGEVLREGGSAVDAVIAGALAACVAEPVLASPMGGGFLMVRPRDGPARLLDFFVQTPRRKRSAAEVDLRGIDADFGPATQGFSIGAGAIACPGAAAGLWEAHRAHGRAPFRDLAAPAVEAAARGTALEPFQTQVLGIVAPIYLASPEARATFCAGGDRTPDAGATYANPALADLLETFAAEGARFMQQGEPAAALAELCRAGGHLTREDMAAYAPVWREPMRVGRGRARLHLNPAPAAGGAMAALILALSEPGASPQMLARAMAAAAQGRRLSGLDADAEAGVRRLADPALLAQLRAALRHPPARRGTTNISAVDGRGFGAALSLSNGEGCGLIAPGTGVMPNNMLGEADLVPEPLGWTPDVRLSSMMAPTAVEWPDGRLAMLGSGGSNRIRSAMAQVLMRLIDDGAPPEDAVAAPRLHVEGGAPPTLDFEDAFPEVDRAALLEDWPEATVWPEPSMFFGGAHVAMRDARGGASAAGDPRRAGAAAVG